MGEVKLTKAQAEGLAALATFRGNVRVPTRSLNNDGVATATLRFLRDSGLAQSEKDSRAVYWWLTDAGRAALRDSTP